MSAAYTADVLANMSGGIGSGVRYLDNVDLTLEIDIAEPWALGTGRLFAYGLYNNGTTFSDELVGDLLVTSNIDAPAGLRIFEFWYEAQGGPWSLRAGLYDLNSEFDVNDAGGLFLNSGHGIGADLGQTGENGPSIFPVSSLAARVAVETAGYSARLAVLDGVPGDPDDSSSNQIDLSKNDGILLVGELDVPIGGSGRLWTGYWRYSADFESPFDGIVRDGNDGWYVGSEFAFRIAERSAAWFVRYGRADQILNVLRAYVGAGLVVHGVISARPEDRMGIAVASGKTGEQFKRWLARSGGEPASHETAWELTYRARLTDRVAVQPDLQFVQNPGGSHRNDDAWVVGVRVEISY